MTARTALIQIARLIAIDMAKGHVGDGLMRVGERLAASPDDVIDVLTLMVKESRKKKPNQGLIEAFGWMTGQTLEILRYGIDRNRPEAAQAVNAVRDWVRNAAASGELDANTLLLILRQFTTAKLEMGDDLHDVMASCMEREPISVLPSKGDLDGMLEDMAHACGGNAFALHAELVEQTSALPDSHRGGIVAALLASTTATAQEAAIGWLLDPGPMTRRATATLLLQAAEAKQVGATALRRLITMRNWLPGDERTGVDAIIRTCRQKGIDCAAAAIPVVHDVLASMIDGSGAQSIFIVLKDGRKQAVAALLLKQGVGVRDAWVDSGLTKQEAEMFLYRVESQADCYDSSIDYLRLALGHALTTALGAGILPPFGLVDIVERVGLSALNPSALPAERLVADLIGNIPGEHRTPEAVESVLKNSGDWEMDYPSLVSWFEDDASLDSLLVGKRLSIKRQIGLVLDQFLPARRARWAELLAWTALTLRQDEATEDDWMDFALVAQCLLENRPLDTIPLMVTVAEKTVDAWKSRQLARR